jgi:hypothetical protein
MGRYSFWMDELESVATVEDAARLLDAEEFHLSIGHIEKMWAVCTADGRPQFWSDSQEGAEATAARDESRWSVEYFESVWLVYIGEKYIFTTGNYAEAEGFVYGMAAHMHFLNGSRSAEPRTPRLGPNAER